MRTIAYKKLGAGAVYIILALVGIVAAISGIALGEKQLALILVGALFAVLGGFYAVKFLSIPYEIIKVDACGRIYLPKNVTLYPLDIVDVSYERAHARGISYKWGDVIITTHSGVYTYSFVADCESVAKELTEMMYRAKYEG